ncbi:hypothetical protein PHYBOEH_006271 [Phytophthora boehmeriae]|uniref:HTH CENPB-type domain-containing protein n=1 Tax=Phytophthora boehmeriae TaxID=109152 RepID=A0A8T1X410_9STRA|nr:hypothetical protein PHYBOEH_006271 [Phytophthora boehmeriae]
MPRNSNRRNLTYREKVAIIRKKDEQPSWTQRNLARWAMEHFGMDKRPTQATISNTLRNREKHLRPDVPPEFCSVRPVKHPEMDVLMIQWVRQELQGDVAITRAAVQKKALEFAQELNLEGSVKFSKGWVSSFMNRHQLNFVRRQGDDTGHLTLVVSAGTDAAAVLVANPPIGMGSIPIDPQQVQQLEQQEQPVDEMEDEDTRVHSEMEFEEDAADNAQEDEVVEEPETIMTESPSTHTGKRRRESSDDTTSPIDPSENTSDRSASGDNEVSGFSADDRATVDVLLDWIIEPGNYSRWWLQKDDADKPQSLLDEIDMFLRSRGLRGMSSAQIKVRIAAFTTSFQAAHTWMRQTGNDYPVGVVTAEQGGIKSHVLQMCPYYEKLAPVLSPYANFDANTADDQRVTAPGTDAPDTVNEEGTPLLSTQGGEVEVDIAGGVTLPKQARRQSTGTTRDDSGDSEEKAQRRRLFELECARLQSEIETKNIQLLVEKSLARKKLLDAGVSPEEVDRILPF